MAVSCVNNFKIKKKVFEIMAEIVLSSEFQGEKCLQKLTQLDL